MKKQKKNWKTTFFKVFLVWQFPGFEPPNGDLLVGYPVLAGDHRGPHPEAWVLGPWTWDLRTFLTFGPRRKMAPTDPGMENAAGIS